MPVDTVKKFLRLESAGGILLILASVVAMIAANSPLAELYDSFLHLPVQVRVGALDIDKSLHHWINDGMMAVFFLLIGLEVKREIMEGELSDRSQIVLPGVAAIGGMFVPAAFYVYFNWDNSVAMNGWAIPAATDIAFALGILSLLGKRVPVTLKLFLMTLAIIDDLGAIVIIAIFYSGDLSMVSLLIAALCIVVLVLMNRRGVTGLTAYMLVGTVLWIAVLKSGVHATLAGVTLAFAIPITSGNKKAGSGDVPAVSPLRHLEHSLHPWVSYMILPVFAFANAGVPLAGMSLSDLFHPVPLGIMLGLFVGKQLGVFGFSWAIIKLGFAKLPDRATWAQLYGVSILCGIGFTMSFFIGSLAFQHTGGEYLMSHRLGILLGSLAAAVIGYAMLKVVPSIDSGEVE